MTALTPDEVLRVFAEANLVPWQNGNGTVSMCPAAVARELLAAREALRKLAPPDLPEATSVPAQTTTLFHISAQAVRDAHACLPEHA